MQERITETNRYKKLTLSQKYKLNSISGAFLAVLGVLIISAADDGTTLRFQRIIISAIGSMLFLIGLWLYAAGINYKAMQDAIRISRKIKPARKRPKKKE